MTPNTTNASPPVESTTEATVDVAAVLAHLREEVRARRMAAAEPDAAHSAIERQLQRCSEQLEITRVVSAHWPLESRSLPQRAHNFVNKVVRRLLRWYINPIVEQQNAFNDTTARTLRLLAEGYSELLYQQAAAADEEHHPPPAAPSDPAPVPPAAPDAPPPDTQALQAVVDEQARREPPAHFPEIALPPLAAQLAQRQQVSAHWPLPEATTAQRLVALVHKLMRFYLRWLINPIVEQQNSFNAAVVESIEPLRQADAEARTLQAARRAQRARPTP